MPRDRAPARIPDPRTWLDTTGRYTRVLLNSPSDDFQIVDTLVIEAGQYFVFGASPAARTRTPRRAST